MDEPLRETERAVRAGGWSARQASMEAVGTPDLIRDMRRGRVPPVERVRALCQPGYCTKPEDYDFGVL